MTKNENFYKSNFSVLGDSISTLEGYSIPHEAAYYDTYHKIESGVYTQNDTWWGQVIEYFGGTLLVNNSVLGSTVSHHPSYEVPLYGCSDYRTSSLHTSEKDPQVIMVFMGINDWGRGIKIFSKDKNDTSLFYCAYLSMLQKLKNNYPEADIWCLTLPVSKNSNKESFDFPYSISGVHIKEYCNAICECANIVGARVIDIYNEAEPYDTVDGFHPTDAGMRTIANAVITNIK